MNEVKLNKDGKSFSVGFKGSSGKSTYGPLSERSDADIKDFLITAYRANRQDYIDLFDSPPTLAELLKEQVQAKLKAGPVEGAYAANPNMLPPGVPHQVAAPPEDRPAAQAASDEIVHAGLPAEGPKVQAPDPAKK